MNDENQQNQQDDKMQKIYENFVHRFFVLDENEKRRYMRYFANAPELIYLNIINAKQQIYSQIMRRTIPEIESYKPKKAKYEYIILILACIYISEQHIQNQAKAKIKEERLKMRIDRQREKKKKTLYEIIRPLYAEITVYRQDKATWNDIVVILRKAHRSMFRGHKLTASYLRRAYNQVAENYKQRLK